MPTVPERIAEIKLRKKSNRIRALLIIIMFEKQKTKKIESINVPQQAFQFKWSTAPTRSIFVKGAGVGRTKCTSLLDECILIWVKNTFMTGCIEKLTFSYFHKLKLKKHIKSPFFWLYFLHISHLSS